MRGFLLTTAGLVIGFGVPLYHLADFALHSTLYSHVVLIPFVSAYLAWNRRDRLRDSGPSLSRVWAVLLLLAGFALLGLFFRQLRTGPAGASREQDALATAMYSLGFLVAASACLWLGRAAVRVLFFPLAFLVFLAPFPTAVEARLETFLQNWSAVNAHAMLWLAGMPVFREGTYFRLPGFSMELAPECSGIHSTLALFITSLVAGDILLRNPWRRAILAFAVIPIALLRNGFRVFTIGELCVNVGPHMIDSYIHRHGGPVFFALSLIPFSLILYLLIRADRRAARTAHVVPSA